MPEIEVIVTTANPVNVSSKQENINVNFGEVLVRSDMHKIEQFTATQGQTEFLLDEYVKRDSQTVFVNGILQNVGVTY